MSDNPRQSRYEVLVDGDPAGFVSYEISGDEISGNETSGAVYALTHTEIDPRFEGQGLGSLLIGRTLEDLRARGAQILPYCRFVRKYLDRHTEYVALVPEDKRPRFDL